MRLLSCHIENFGKWQDFTYSFTEGNNILCEENGWGKSTLAAFLKIMFYGFQADTKRDDYENDRKRYAPWSKGTYGGELQFEAAGKRYSLRRVFGRKSQEDEFALYDLDTMLPSKDFSEKIGEELFQIDAEGFERTVFFTQLDCVTQTTDSINAKLGNLAENTDDINNFDSADKRFKDLLNSMAPGKKTGSIHRLKVRAGELEAELLAGEKLQDTVDKAREKQSFCKRMWEENRKEQESLQNLQKTAARYKDLQRKKDQFEDVDREYVKRGEQLRLAQERFPGEIPEKEEVQGLVETCNRLAKQQAMVLAIGLTEEEEQNLKKLRESYPKEPAKEDLTELEAAAVCLEKLEWEKEALRMNEDESSRLRMLQEKYKGQVPSKTLLEVSQNTYRNYSDIMSQISTEEAKQQAKENFQEQALSRQKHTDKVVKLLLFGGSLGLLVLAGVLYMWVWPVAGISLAGAGLLLLLVGILFAAGRKKRYAAWFQTDDAAIWELERLTQEADQGRARLTDFCRHCGFEFREDMFTEQLLTCREDVEQYEKLSLKQKKEAAFLEQPEWERCRNTCEEFEKQYGILVKDLSGEKMIACISRVREDLQMKQMLEKKLENQRLNKESEQELTDKVNVFYERFQLSTDLKPEQILENLRVLTGAQEEYAGVEETRKLLLEDEELSNLRGRSLPEISMEELADRLIHIAREQELLLKESNEYAIQIEEQEALLEELQMKKEELNSIKQQIEEETGKYHLLVRTKELLQKAKSSFTARYTEPIMCGFRKYYEMLSDKSSENYIMDANTKLSLSQDNMLHDLQFESAGNQDLVGICMRMALVEAMYTEEKPFLILDDPFVNLDKEKTKGAIQFLKTISKDYQVIYFTCHESRSY